MTPTSPLPPLRLRRNSIRPPVWDVEVEAGSRHIGTNAYVTVNARNADDVPLTIELITSYASRTVAGVVPGKAAYQAFNTRSTLVPAGIATVKVTGTRDGSTVTAQIEAPYGALGG
ncbi:hypothetical protein [Micromonospora cremea]|uniref:Uncharacterized protein n=1 Tax=Micromonospora cremea TaxID=709881 RepID=A0A1N5U3L4_9ACTN|nr:hypothetical protein [Micromonospora cremea]SIM55384.1 hypothetical protein SAMN04489832_0588 [Micromonospora cremea]